MRYLLGQSFDYAFEVPTTDTAAIERELDSRGIGPEARIVIPGKAVVVVGRGSIADRLALSRSLSRVASGARLVPSATLLTQPSSVFSELEQERLARQAAASY